MCKIEEEEEVPTVSALQVCVLQLFCWQRGKDVRLFLFRDERLLKKEAGREKSWRLSAFK